MTDYKYNDIQSIAIDNEKLEDAILKIREVRKESELTFELSSNDFYNPKKSILKMETFSVEFSLAIIKEIERVIDINKEQIRKLLR